MSAQAQRLLLCTDMDRTVIPNGTHPEHPDARDRFRRFCALPQVRLVYVTGRHRALVEQAIADFNLPAPDYVITDVGTRIYSIDSGQWRELSRWQDYISQFWHGKSNADLRELLWDIPGLKLQEEHKQSKYKLSFYLALAPDNTAIVAQIRTRLHAAGVRASVVWSVDELNATGLIDVLPVHTTKLEAIEFLQQELRYNDTNTIFAGDSGNDLEVLVSHIPAVLVGNASDEVRTAAQQAVVQNGNLAKFFQAQDEPQHMPGNYSAGVLQGVWHFAPQLREFFDATYERMS